MKKRTESCYCMLRVIAFFLVFDSFCVCVVCVFNRFCASNKQVKSRSHYPSVFKLLQDVRQMYENAKILEHKQVMNFAEPCIDLIDLTDCCTTRKDGNWNKVNWGSGNTLVISQNDEV